MAMERTRLFLITFFCAFLAFVFVIIAFATNEWIVVNISGIKIISLGLWKYCMLNKCYSDVVTIPAGLTIVTIILILISLLLTPLINTGKRFSSSILFIPVIFFFLSIIVLLAVIVVFWPKLPQRSYEEAINNILDESSLDEWLAKERKTDRSHSQGHKSPITTVDKWNINKQELDNLYDLINIDHGFSSALLISALPLLIICLVISTFVAAFRQAECIATQNNVGIAYIDYKH